MIYKYGILWYDVTMLCYDVMLWCNMLCYVTMLWYDVVCYVTMYYVIMCYVMNNDMVYVKCFDIVTSWSMFTDIKSHGKNKFFKLWDKTS